MEFEIKVELYIEEESLEKMVSLCKEKGFSPKDAFWEVAPSFDDAEYCLADYVEDQVVEEIERRLEE
jgi:hypothetical protein